MKVYFDSYAFRLQRVGGISRYFAELMARLPDYGIETLFFMPLVDNEHAVSARLSWPLIELLRRDPRIRHRLHSLLRRADPLLRRFGRYDVWHRTYYEDPAIPFSRRSACTIVDMIPELLPSHFTANPHLDKRAVALKSDLIFSISESTSRDIAAVYGIEAARIVTTPLGIDLQSFSIDHTVSNPFRPPYVLFVGRRDGYKNFARFVKAMVPLMAEHPTLSLALVGGGPLNGAEKDLFGSAALAARVCQADVPDRALPRIYRDAELFVFPSEYEGFGLPLLEAFASRCPVAASRASSFPEIGGAAIEYFDPRSADDISQAVHRIVGSARRADELRALGADRVGQFTWDRTVQLTAAAYRRLP